MTKASHTSTSSVMRVFAALLVVALCAGSASRVPFSSSAWADVRHDDIIHGTVMEDLDVDAARLPNIYAEYALLVDQEGTPYFAREPDEPTHIASITKVMTATVALEHASLDEQVTISAAAASIGESSAYLQEGDVLTMEQALMAMLIPSGNDAALAIAQQVGANLLQAGADPSDSTEGGASPLQVSDEAKAHFDELGIDIEALATSGDAESVFVAAMNLKAFEIGMDNSVFANSHGLDTGSHQGTMQSTTTDVATMCRYAMDNETFRSIVAMGETTIDVTRGEAKVAVELKPTDLLIGTYEGACGIKTGFTNQAGASFAGACNRDGAYLYAIVLNSPSEDQRFDDAITLYDWYYQNHEYYKLVTSDEFTDMTVAGTTKTVPVVAEVSHSGWLDKTVTATVSDPDASIEVFALDGNISQEVEFADVTGDVHAGDVVGTVTYYQKNTPITSMDLIAAEDVAGPNFLEGVSIWWQRFFGGFNNEPSQAESYVVSEMPLIYDRSNSINKAA